MLLLLSPAKTLDLSPTRYKPFTEARLLDDSQELVDILRQNSVADLQELMSISEALAEENAKRFQSFRRPFTTENAKPAVLTFKGDVYQGLGAEDFSEEDLAFAQDRLRILSGLYGVLRPLDLMQAYRLEMGTKLPNARGKNLYEFWDDKITNLLNQDLRQTGGKAVINLASKEYFSAVHPKALDAPLYQIDFKELRGNTYKVIPFNAKKARGLMARFVVQHRLSDPKDLRGFDLDDYHFNEDLSREQHFVFTR